MAVLVKGKQAHDAVASDQWPVPTGSTARASTPAAVSAADVVEFFTDRNGRQIMRRDVQVPTTHAPAANTVAIAQKASAGAGIKNVCTGVSICLTAGASAPTAAVLVVNLRDGATTAGTILATWAMAITAVAGAMAPPINLSDLWLEGSAATAMTLEFTAAGGANTIESVTLFTTTAV